jgi:hypothetical protein
MGMGDVDFAMKFRDVMTGMVVSLLERLRPLPRYGYVQSLNRFTGDADVVFDGDTVTTRCRMVRGTEPTNSRVNNIPNDPNYVAKVKVEGKPGSYWITEILNESEFTVEPNLFHPQLWGGGFLHIPTAKFDTFQAGLPALGSTWHIGRWDNGSSFASDATGYLEIEVQWTFFTSQVKHYSVPIKSNETVGTWRKLAPNLDSGPDGDNDFQLEILIDGTGYELRIRRTQQGGGFSPGGYDVRQWIFLDSVLKVEGSDQGEAATTEPTSFKGTDDPHHKGPFAGPMHTSPRWAQGNLSGGGRITWDGAKLDWSQFFRTAGLGKGYHARDGYFDISRPGDGISIPIYSKAGATTATIAGGIPLTGNQSLYYEVPWGNISSSFGFGMRIVDIADPDFIPPSNWILLATRNDLVGTPSLKLGTGEQIDHWRAVTFTNGWANNGGGHETCAYRITDGRMVMFKGLALQATAGSVNTSIFTLPTEYRPSATHIFLCYGGALAAAKEQRIDVTSGGSVLVSAAPATASSLMSLSQIEFFLS